MSRTLLRRAGITLATGALAVTGVLTSAPTASAAPADDAAGWLGGQLKGGVMYNPDFGGFNDYGLTADAGFALIEVGGKDRKVQQIRKGLQANVDSWTTGVDFGSDDVYAGSVAKALAFATEAPKARPRSFGGVDLVERLEARVTDAGRLSDSGAEDYANTIGQAFAVRGLTETGSSEAGAATSFLLQQQCAEGFFRLDFSAPGAADQGCDAAGGEADLDVTALALLNLQEVDDPTRAVKRATASGLAWVADQQRRNGSFAGSGPTAVPNANSTGLAAWALGEAGRCRPAAKAASWVRGLQLGNGAIAYDRAAADAGVTPQTRDQFRRATAQAAPGLEYLRVKACRA
ncbi:hypothetical protein [Nocardioides sp. AX2bis]|uniref:hypothetical protein n=1 Tax=Nocardioides sp. AX2bis TaxID=2653157 RepID=UPI0012F0CB63|nr:hypothetical protein [Nocardioides sp. AX2bis]VXB84071.1 conserved exported hypothetical protein [Nocardioides sp. AX2bis]